MAWTPCSYDAIPEDDPEMYSSCSRATSFFLQHVHNPVDAFMFFMNESVWVHIARCTDARRKKDVEESSELHQENTENEAMPASANRNDQAWMKKPITPNRIMVFVALLMQNTLHHFPEGKYYVSLFIIQL